MSDAARIDRRAFLGRAATGTAALAAVGLGSPRLVPDLLERGGPGHAKSLGSANLQLDWIEDVEFAGSYIARTKGYYAKEGLHVGLLPGGPSTTVEPIVVSGRALVGLSGPDITSQAINHGAKLTIIGAQMQKAPQAIMSLAKSPIRTPHDMIGKKIGVQAANLDTWNAFLKLAKVPASKVTVVPVQFDPSPLAAGEVDGWYSFITNEPFLLAAKGVKTYTFLLYNYGYRIYSGTYCCRTASLHNPKERAQIIALMRGELMGWHRAFADPTLAAHLTVDVYGKTNGLDVPTQRKELFAYKKLFETPTTRANGLFWMAPAQIEANIHTMRVAGIKSKPSYFTDEILKAIPLSVRKGT